MERKMCTFFQVPKFAETRWSRVCCMELTEKERICGEHFRPSDIITWGGRKHLLPDAVPYLSPLQITSSNLTPIVQRNSIKEMLETSFGFSHSHSSKIKDSGFFSQPNRIRSHGLEFEKLDVFLNESSIDIKWVKLYNLQLETCILK